MKKGVGPALGPDLEPNPLVSGTDPGIRIRNKMSRIPNTASTIKLLLESSPSSSLLSSSLISVFTKNYSLSKFSFLN
jgi:hypothetical protein